MKIHHPVQKIPTYVRQSFLYDGDQAYSNTFSKANIICISSYVDHALTVQVVLDDGSLFSYIPLHALSQTPKTPSKPLGLEDLVYKNCPGEDIVVTTYPALANLQAYFKKKNQWHSGRYITSIDWPAENEQFHFIALENGQYAALPNHKVLFGDQRYQRRFKPYRKMHCEWKI